MGKWRLKLTTLRHLLPKDKLVDKPPALLIAGKVWYVRHTERPFCT